MRLFLIEKLKGLRVEGRDENEYTFQLFNPSTVQLLNYSTLKLFNS